MIPKHELKRWAKDHFKGLENTLFPSFSPDMLSLDEDGIRWDVRQSIAHGFTSMMGATEVGLSFFEQQFAPTFMSGTYHWTQQKYYQWCVGGNGGPVRQPSMKLHQHDMDMTKIAFRSIGITPREPDAEFYAGRLNYEKLHKAHSQDTAQHV